MAASVPELTSRSNSMEGTALVDEPGKLDLGLGGSAEGGAAGDSLLDGPNDGGMGVAEDQRPPGTDVVDVLVAVDVPDVGAEAPLDEGAGCRRPLGRSARGC